MREALAVVAILAVTLGACALLGGCATSDQPVAQRAQTLMLRDCTVTVNVGSADAATNPPSVELLTNTQSNEGSEAATPTATPTTDVKPTTTATVPLGSASSGSSLGSAAAALVKAGVDALADDDDTASTTSATASDSTASATASDSTASDCSGGVCAP